MAMLYMMFMILSGITIYKAVDLGGFVIPAAVIVTPFIYSISNITTEVYGYTVARNMMWWFILSSTIFVICSTFLIHAPSPPYFKNQAAFNLVLGSMPIVYIAGILGSIIGLSFNNFFVSKYKVILVGKKYWLRSILSTAGGEVVYNLVAYPIMFFGRVSLEEFFKILLCVSLFKVGTTALIWPFECLMAALLKKAEGVDTIDYGIDYTVFAYSLRNKENTM